MPERLFPLPKGALFDLSVSTSEEAELRRSWWTVGVKVDLPDWVDRQDPRGLINFVDAHLCGRDPMTGSGQGELFVMFRVIDGSAHTRQLVDQFAASFASPQAFGPEVGPTIQTGISYTDLSDLDPMLPPEFRAAG